MKRCLVLFLTLSGLLGISAVLSSCGNGDTSSEVAKELSTAERKDLSSGQVQSVTNACFWSGITSPDIDYLSTSWWTVGGTYTIKWDPDCLPGVDKVAIVCCQSHDHDTPGKSSGAVTLTKSTPNDGQYDWYITRYHLRGAFSKDITIHNAANWNEYLLFHGFHFQVFTLWAAARNESGSKSSAATGDKVEIWWTCTIRREDYCHIGPTVSIELLEYDRDAPFASDARDKHVAWITKSTKTETSGGATGQYIWTIPHDLPTGSYDIKVKSRSNSDVWERVTGGGYGGFEITNSTKLTVLSPARSSSKQRGRKYRIKWKGSNWVRTVSIQLLRERSRNNYVHDRWISRKTRNDGNFVWKFPLSLKDTYPWGRSGPRYKIKITAPQYGAVGEGGYFYVTGNISKLRCGKSANCTVEVRGDILPIRWKPGSDKGPVKISIRREKTHYRWITKKTRNDGAFNWKISGKSGPPRYLRVTSIKNPTNWIERSFTIRPY